MVFKSRVRILALRNPRNISVTRQKYSFMLFFGLLVLYPMLSHNFTFTFSNSETSVVIGKKPQELKLQIFCEVMKILPKWVSVILFMCPLISRLANWGQFITQSFSMLVSKYKVRFCKLTSPRKKSLVISSEIRHHPD